MGAQETSDVDLAVKPRHFIDYWCVFDRKAVPDPLR